ncbi:NAD(P)-dependent oxidoreductase [Actinomycetospora sp. TBRC 11914]|uniref:NAD-dependent epimerase/dehydratase family protein n=1 Tax=Actinomycetospora sp. TBRC 11914 TaxID=2729387 RepID=UPI00145C9023|nr:NAD(P)-dependent oxidoreductase [Actinomycetospora sp. TBRC 11914]NMO91554.1 NAD(P)-dependent oxidoreductase [Actinomycetospora sp. TBRC 11914]
MRVLVAGATGVIGRAVVPLLTAVGHDVTALSRRGDPRGVLAGTGARVVAADALDRVALRSAVLAAGPDAVVNLMTAIPGELRPRRFARDFATTNRLRREGTRHLLGAAQDVGARRVVAEGLAFAYDPDGTGPAVEDDPFWADPPRSFRPALEALEELEQRTRAMNGTVLRFGHLYGPGTPYAADGSTVAAVRAGKMPLVRDGRAVFSFTHVDDAASAVVATLDRRRPPGVLNIVDDDPAPVSEWVPELARLLDAPAPSVVPSWLVSLAAGAMGRAFMTQLRGADNARARLDLDWRPRFPSWREGFAAELAGRRSVA